MPFLQFFSAAGTKLRHFNGKQCKMLQKAAFSNSKIEKIDLPQAILELFIDGTQLKFVDLEEF